MNIAKVYNFRKYEYRNGFDKWFFCMILKILFDLDWEFFTYSTQFGNVSNLMIENFHNTSKTYDLKSSLHREAPNSIVKIEIQKIIIAI